MSVFNWQLYFAKVVRYWYALYLILDFDRYNFTLL